MAFCSAGDLSLYIKKGGHLPSPSEPVYNDADQEGVVAYPHPVDGGLNETVVRSFLAQLAAALEFMRKKNIVHRDIKPQVGPCWRPWRRLAWESVVVGSLSVGMWGPHAQNGLDWSIYVEIAQERRAIRTCPYCAAPGSCPRGGSFLPMGRAGMGGSRVLMGRVVRAVMTIPKCAGQSSSSLQDTCGAFLMCGYTHC